MMINLGLSEMRFIETYISNKIRRLLKSPIKKKNIFRLSSEGAHFLVIFSKSPSLFIKEEIYSVIIISEKLQLPRFTLTSKLNLTSRLDSIMNSTMDEIAKLEAGDKKLKKIAIPDFPELNEKFVLLGEDEKSVIRFYSKERSKKISLIKNSIELSAQSDLFTIKLDTSHHDEISEEEKMRRSIKTARRLYHIFAS